MYVLAPNHTVKTYPYSVGDLQRDNPGTSFPAVLSKQTLTEWDVFPVIDKLAPNYNQATENCNQVNPTLISGQWVMTWVVTAATPEEIAERTKQKAAEVRQQRNSLLSACDWTQLPDALVPAAPWTTYRQELRNVPAQVGFPWDVVWPEAP
jgi:hypothetical protein